MRSGVNAPHSISGLVGLLCWSALLVGCAGRRPSPVDPVRPATLRTTVDALLGQPESATSDEDWRRLPADALDLVAQIERDTSGSAEKRLPAIGAMAPVTSPGPSE